MCNLLSKVADAAITVLIKMPFILVRLFFFSFARQCRLYRFAEQNKLHQKKSIFACSPAQLCQLEVWFLFPHIIAELHHLK